MIAHVQSVHVGQIKSLGPTTSAIDKQSVVTPVKVGVLGIEGDCQADLRVHGGADKAVHCYPWQHYEHWRLVHLGKTQLADRVEHVSKSKGDGLGYDVLSFDPSGRERFIEVKTTAYSKETPFYVTRGELSFSREASTQFHLCRVFDFRKDPRLFSLKGRLDDHCQLDPVTYQASFG